MKMVRQSKLVFAVTLNNTGYPMVRQAREMIAGGELGELRIVHAAYIQDWLTLPIDADGQKQAEWRTDPARAGLSACLADIGVHAHSLAQFVTGLDVAQVSADLTTFVAGRRLDDNAHVMLRYANGARGSLLASQVAPGNLNSLSLKVYGTKAGLEWSGETPEQLRFTPFGESTRILVRGGPGNSSEAKRGSRMPAGHPEGYIEGFANLYRDAASLIQARRAGQPFDPLAAAYVPTVIDGAKGIRFVEAAVQSAAPTANGVGELRGHEGRGREGLKTSRHGFAGCDGSVVGGYTRSTPGPPHPPPRRRRSTGHAPPVLAS
jgi:predicted dehydrogenase